MWQLLESIKSRFKKERSAAKLISQQERRICHLSKKHLRAELWLYRKCLSLHMRSIRLSRMALEQNENTNDLFEEAFVRLSVKVMHNAESLRHLILNGLYGSCFVLKRTLIFDVHMIWYLYFKPDLIESWLSEKFITYKDRKWRDLFSEKSIIEELEKRGQEFKLQITDTEFSFYSKAGHPCFFSIRFFQNKNNSLAYMPDFQFQTAQWMTWRVIGLLLYPTQVYLLQNKDNKSDELVALRDEYNRLMQTANQFGLKVVETHKNVYQAKSLEEIKFT